MRLISEQLGLTRTFFLKERLRAIPLVSKATPDIMRVDKEKLEACYIEDETIFKAINFISQLIMKAGYHFEGEDNSVAFVEGFFEGIGSRGGLITVEELLERTFRYQCIYGDAFWEIIRAGNKTGKIPGTINDLDIIDPKRMDYAKTTRQLIALDKSLNPIGYTYRLPYGIEPPKIIEPPENVILTGREIFLPPERIAHFKMFPFGEGFYGLGLIEPIYTITQWKLKNLEGFGNAAIRLGNPLIVGKVGDAAHEPTTDQIQSMANELKDISAQNAFAHSYYDQLYILESKGVRFLRTYLDFWVDQQVTGLMVPKPFATGLGEATNRATLKSQEYMLKLSLYPIIKRTLSEIQRKIISPLCIDRNLRPPKMVWGEIALEEMDAKVDRITKLVKAGLIQPDRRLEDFIRKIEELPAKV